MYVFKVLSKYLYFFCSQKNGSFANFSPKKIQNFLLWFWACLPLLVSNFQYCLVGWWLFTCWLFCLVGWWLFTCWLFCLVGWWLFTCWLFCLVGWWLFTCWLFCFWACGRFLGLDWWLSSSLKILLGFQLIFSAIRRVGIPGNYTCLFFCYCIINYSTASDDVSPFWIPFVFIHHSSILPPQLYLQFSVSKPCERPIT